MSKVDSEKAAATGCFVYGVVPGDVTATGDAAGLGDPPAEVVAVRHGRIAALVSEVRLDRPLGQPEDLVAYQRLLDGTAEQAPVLPLRFGSTMADQEAVRRLLADNEDAFVRALEDLEGRVEFIVRGRYVERELLARVLAGVPEAARLRDETRGRPEELTREDRIRLGEIVHEAVEAERANDTGHVTQALAPLGATVQRPPTHELDAVYLAVLVDRDRAGELGRAVDRIAQQWRGRVEMRLLGPLAPYDFLPVPAGGG